MTKEEYIEFANALKNNYTIDFDKLPEFCDMAIEAIKQEQYYKDLANSYEETIRKLTKALEPKMGQWIKRGCTEYCWECNKCKAHHRAVYDFCPSCGAKMDSEEI